MKRTTAPNNVGNQFVDENPGVSLGTSIIAEDQGNHQEELVNAILSANISLSGADQSQLGKAMANMAAYGNFYTEAGGSAANAYVLERVSPRLGITQYYDGMVIQFRVTNTSTAGAVTVQVGSLTAKSVTVEGQNPGVVDFFAGDIVTLVYNAGQDRFDYFRVGEPTGTTKLFLTTTLPVEYLYANGQNVSRTTYAKLFAVYGTTYGPGDGSTTFTLPDSRGLFPRFADDGAGIDPDAASRTDRGDGTTGDFVGTKQDFAVEEHSADVYEQLAQVAEAGGVTTGFFPVVKTGTTVFGVGDKFYTKDVYNANVSTETRGANLAFKLGIKI